jgi:hypothetical protein
MVSDTDKLHTGAANPATTGEHFVGSTPSPDTEAVEGLVERLRRVQEYGRGPECSVFMPVNPDGPEAANRILALTEAVGRQTALVDRLCSAVEREVEGIGGEGSLAVLRLLGPVNDEAIALLGGREALKLSDAIQKG